MEGHVLRKDAELNMATVSLVQGDSFAGARHSLAAWTSVYGVGQGGLSTRYDREPEAGRALLAGREPSGKRLRRGMPETPTPWLTVVGVVDDVKLGSARSRDSRTVLSAYDSAGHLGRSFAPQPATDRYLRLYRLAHGHSYPDSWRTRFWPPYENRSSAPPGRHADDGGV